jgi:hypothetical protein
MHTMHEPASLSLLSQNIRIIFIGQEMIKNQSKLWHCCMHKDCYFLVCLLFAIAHLVCQLPTRTVLLSSLSLSLSLSISLSLSLSMSPFIYLSFSIYLSIYLPVSLSLSLSRIMPNNTTASHYSHTFSASTILTLYLMVRVG